MGTHRRGGRDASAKPIAHQSRDETADRNRDLVGEVAVDPTLVRWVTVSSASSSDQLLSSIAVLEFLRGVGLAQIDEESWRRKNERAGRRSTHCRGPFVREARWF
jgi:hypothetical protein